MSLFAHQRHATTPARGYRLQFSTLGKARRNSWAVIRKINCAASSLTHGLWHNLRGSPILFFCLLLVSENCPGCSHKYRCTSLANAASASSPSGQPNPVASGRAPVKPLPPAGNAKRIIEIYEIEDERPQSHRPQHGDVFAHAKNTTYQHKAWLTSDGKLSPTPVNFSLPRGWEWACDWKIDVGGNRDENGWEYIEAKETAFASKVLRRRDSARTRTRRRRRRRWLRTSQPISAIVSPTESEALLAKVNQTSVLNQPLKKSRHRQSRIRKFASDIYQEEFQFKGFGWCFYKSIIFKESCGAALRLPLSINFDSFERRPYLPSVASSFCLFYPWTAGIFLNMSLPCELLRHFLFLSLQYLQRIVLVAVLMVTGLKGKVDLPPLVRSPLRYSQNVQERIGITMSWRISQLRGYEFRVSTWHVYLPTMEFMLRTLSTINTNLVLAITKVISKEASAERQRQMARKSTKDRVLMEWLRQRTASVGLTTAYPIPVPPFYSCSAMLSLSGFRYTNTVRNLLHATIGRRTFEVRPHAIQASDDYSDEVEERVEFKNEESMPGRTRNDRRSGPTPPLFFRKPAPLSAPALDASSTTRGLSSASRGTSIDNQLPETMLEEEVHIIERDSGAVKTVKT